jgi:hypothetical protein
VGDDVNPCSRTAPCKTFAGAISKTATNGEINCLDPGGFGGVTITKSITIDCTGTIGSILGSSTNGVNVNGANVIVKLRGLSINGAVTGFVGVNFIQGAVLMVENCEIMNFQAGNAAGIRFAPGAAAKLFVVNTNMTGNGTGATGGGIVVQPSGAGNVHAVISKSALSSNSMGISAVGSGTTGGVFVTVSDTVSANNSQNGIQAVTTSGITTLMVDRSTVMGNAIGLRVDGSLATIRFSNSVVTANATGLSAANSGSLLTYTSTNDVNGNTTSDGAPTGTVPQT